ncbi:MAG: peptidoglycan DD-metalloendopeptidase family protein [Tetragenococcus koreensis]|nr:peptidoglycan DD-metalloendopeptidase family protein [Tetragenococcus koreensis]
MKLRATQILNALKLAISAIWNGIKFLAVATWNGIKWVVVNAVNGLKIAAIAVFNALKWSISTIFNGIKFIATSVWNGIKWVVVNAVRGLKAVAIATFNALKWSITTIFNGIKFIATSVWNGIKWVVVNAAKGLKNIALATFRLLKAGVTAIWNGIKLATSTVWNWIKNTVIRLATALRNTALAVFRAFRSGLTAIWNTMKSVASATWNWIKNKVIALARTLRSTAIAVFNALKNGVSAIWNAIKSATSAAWNWIKNKVIALARTLRNTVVNVFNAFKNTISNIWNAIKGFTSRIWNGLKNTVVNLATGLKNTVVSRFNTLKNAVSGIWGKIKSTAINTWQGIKDKITGFATGIKDGVTGTFSKMADVLKGTIGKIKGFVQDMVDKVKGGLNKLIDGVNWVGDKLGMGEIGHVKMHTGTSSSGSVTRNGKMSKDVMATVGDKGKGNGPGGFRHETVIPPKGKPFITPNRDTLMPATKGTAIMNGAQTHAMLSGGTHAFAKGTGVAGGKKPEKQKKGSNIFGDVLNKTKKGAEALTGTVVESGKAAVDKTLSGVNKGKDWLADKVGDVMDFIDNPEKLLDKVLKGFGVGFDLAKDTLPADMMKGMFKKLKNAATDTFKSWFEESSEGDGGYIDLSKGINFPFSPNGHAPGYPFSGPHNGVDLGYNYDKVYSVLSGTATASKGYNGGFGNMVEIVNGATKTIYGHLHEQAFSGSKKVKPGDYLGISGGDPSKDGAGAGKSSGAHLHFEVQKNGVPINPLEWLKKNNGSGKSKKASAWSGDIKKAAKKMNVKLQGNDLKNIVSLINAESSGNAGATQGGVNDINSQQGNPAQGLLQYIPKTFKNYATKGHGNIKSGYDQLLAFFNNKSWRSQFNPNGGWSPSGAVRGYANGGIINAPEMAWLAEGGFSESVISHDPRQRTRSKALHDKTGKMLGVDDEAPLLREIIDILEAGNQLQSQNNNATRQLLNKELNVYLNRKKITEEVNRESANIFDGQLYNQGG